MHWRDDHGGDAMAQFFFLMGKLGEARVRGNNKFPCCNEENITMKRRNGDLEQVDKPQN